MSTSTSDTPETTSEANGPVDQSCGRTANRATGRGWQHGRFH